MDPFNKQSKGFTKYAETKTFADHCGDLYYLRKISDGVLNGKLQSRRHRAPEAEQPELRPGSGTPEEDSLPACVSFSLLKAGPEDQLPFSFLLSLL